MKRVVAFVSSVVVSAAACAVHPTANIAQNRNVVVSAAGVRLTRGGVPVALPPFAETSSWVVVNYEGRMNVRPVDDGLELGPCSNRIDTAWCVKSKKTPLPSGGGTSFRLAVEAESTLEIFDTAGKGPWNSCVVWYDAAGREIARTPLHVFFSVGSWTDVSADGVVPAGAASFAVQLGSDEPNLNLPRHVLRLRRPRFAVSRGEAYEKRGAIVSEVRRGGSVSWKAVTPRGTAVRLQWRGAETAEDLLLRPFVGPNGDPSRFYEGAFRAEAPLVQYRVLLTGGGTATPTLESVTCGERTDADWSLVRDACPPTVEVVSPLAQHATTAPFSLRVTDASAVLWRSLACRLDGADVTARLERQGDVVSLAAPEGGWSNGLHRAVVKVADFHGNAVTARRFFYVGARPAVPKVTLRDDGMTLVDGEPFFPIGIYSVSARKFNGHSLDRAIGDLKAAGFNLAHTYGDAYSPAFLAALKKHGMKAIVHHREPTKAFLTKGLSCSEIIAWYLGDDTSLHETPEELSGYQDAAKAIDPNRLTVQADWIHGERPVSSYAAYVTGTDVFLPEIYPLRAALGEKMHPGCVAETVRDMRRCQDDIAAARKEGDTRPRALWPILQYFIGWDGWKEFPTRDELFATSFAALACGAQGITWYTYGGSGGDDPKCRNYGVTSTPERWQTICELAGRIRSLIPFLVARTPAVQPTVTVEKGPSKALYGQPAVSVLLKRLNGGTLVFAVNATTETLSVRLSDLPCCDGSANVLWEDRGIPFSGGMLRDDFAPFAVHVYRF